MENSKNLKELFEERKKIYEELSSLERDYSSINIIDNNFLDKIKILVKIEKEILKHTTWRIG